MDKARNEVSNLKSCQNIKEMSDLLKEKKKDSSHQFVEAFKRLSPKLGAIPDLCFEPLEKQVILFKAIRVFRQ